jgi:hypothetical protein
MPGISNLVIDPDRAVHYTSQDISDNEVPKFYRQELSGPNADL